MPAVIPRPQVSREKALTVEDCPDDMPNGMATILTVQKQPHGVETMRAMLDSKGYVRGLDDKRSYFRKEEWTVFVEL